MSIVSQSVVATYSPTSMVYTMVLRDNDLFIRRNFDKVSVHCNFWIFLCKCHESQISIMSKNEKNKRVGKRIKIQKKNNDNEWSTICFCTVGYMKHTQTMVKFVIQLHRMLTKLNQLDYKCNHESTHTHIHTLDMI